jgi:23S rRNA pseudouridine1911/1915/1917 synthase
LPDRQLTTKASDPGGKEAVTTAREGGVRRLTVAEGAHRLDRYLADRLGMSRSRVAGLILEDRVRVNGRPARKSDTVTPGQEVEVHVPPPAPLEARAEDIPLEIVYEDDALLVVNKAAGLVVHPAPGHPDGTLVNALLFHVTDLSGIGGTLRPGIVHRLDRDTSGLMVVAKGDDAHLALSNAIRRREVRRIYRAVAWGHLPESPVTVDAPIGRDPRDRKRMAVVEGGRRAVTRFRVRERWRAAELLDVALKTGRTHQIRVHLAHLGHPVVGDEIYGRDWGRGMGGPMRVWARELRRMAKRQLLHASDLVFRHPVSGKEMHFRAPFPEDLAEVVSWARRGARGGVQGEGTE